MLSRANIMEIHMSDPLKGWIKMTDMGIEQQFSAEHLEWVRQNDPPELVYTAELHEDQYVTVRLLPAAPKDQHIVSVNVDGVDNADLEYELQYVG
jgi:hypothetical protein